MRMLSRSGFSWIIVAALWIAPAVDATQSSIYLDTAQIDDHERALFEVIDDVSAGRLTSAVEKARRLTESNSTFRLAQLVYADLLKAQDNPMQSFGGHYASANKDVAPLLEEVRRRLAHRDSEPRLVQGLWPEYLVQLSASQRQVILVDASMSRLHVFANDGNNLLLIGDYFVSVGKRGMLKAKEGDQRSPIGVYFITSRLDPRELADLYGSAALPINYPNEWDRRLGRTGYGIWLHGVPSDTYNRAPFASDGCLALTNRDIALLSDTVDVGTTPVIITNRVNWLSARDMASRRQTFLKRVEQWKKDWESRDSARYARHYSKSFRNETMNYDRWTRHKRRVAKQKTYIKLKLSDISVFQYPGETDLRVVSFKQDYRSSNFNTRSRKRQYWRKESDGEWRIVYESRAKFLPIHFRGIPYSARSTASR